MSNLHQGRLLYQPGKVLPYHSSSHGEKLTRLSVPSMLKPQGRARSWGSIPRTFSEHARLPEELQTMDHPGRDCQTVRNGMFETRLRTDGSGAPLLFLHGAAGPVG